jgi:hypothetical protein
MIRVWDESKNCLITLLGEDMSPLHPAAERWIQEFNQRFVLVGLISPMPDVLLTKYFQSEHPNPVALRVMSRKARVRKGWDGRLHILSWLPGLKNPKEYVPKDDEDVIIGDMPLTDPNVSRFLTLLDSHQPLPYRRSRLASSRIL